MALTGKRTDEKANAELTRRFFEEFVNTGDAEVGRELLAEDYVRHDPTPEGTLHGRDAMIEYITEMRRAFPDASIHVDELFTADDKVVVRATERGTHEGTFMEMEPTGKEIEVTGIVIHRVEDGHLTETWAQWDTLGMMRQLEVESTLEEGSTEPSSSAETNEEIARMYLEEVAMRGNLDALRDLVAEDVVNHNPISGTETDPETMHGIEAFREHVVALRTAFPDARIDVQDTIAEGDEVMVRFVLSGTHDGPLMGIDPTGRSVTMSGMVVYRIEDEKIVERWSEANTLGLMQQLGVVSGPRP